MANEIVRPSLLPPRANPVASEVVPSDNGATVGAVTWEAGVNAGRPIATQQEAETGTNPTKAMTPLTTAQHVSSRIGVDIASKVQGDLADSAVQPGDLAAVATTGDYGDLSGKPTLGTAAATDATDYATAARGLPSGGLASQSLIKSSGSDYDVEWATSAAATAVSYAHQSLTLAQQGQARANIDAGILSGFRNKIINGRFLVNQEAMSGSLPAGQSAYITDMWEVQNTTNQALTWSIASSHSYNRDEVENYLAISFASAPTSGDVFLFQKVEDVRTLAGKTATSLMRILRAHPGALVETYLTQNFGSGGSLQVVTTPESLANVAGSQRAIHDIPTVAGKTIGTASYLTLIHKFTPRTADYCVLTELGLVEGDAIAEANPFAARPVQQELALCQRYYSKAVAFQVITAAGAGNYVTATANAPVTMRTTPSASLVGEGSGNVNVNSASIDTLTPYGGRCITTSSAASTAQLSVRATFNARL